MRVHFSIECKFLKNVAGRLRARSDPYAIVEMEGICVGQTETIKNDLSPFFTKVFIVEGHEARPGQYVQVAIFDDNSSRNREDVEMGRALFELSSVLARGGKIERQETGVGKGQIIMHASEIVQGESIGTMQIQFRALGVKNIDKGLLGLNSTDPFYEISKKYSDPSVGISRWLPVVRSEYKQDILNPFWNPFTIGLEELCNCNLETSIKITIFDWENDNDHREVGYIETTVSQLMKKKSKRGNADKENAMIIREATEDYSSASTAAHLVVLKCDLVG